MTQLLSPQTIFPFSQVQQTNWFLYQLNSAELQDKVSLAIEIYSEIDLVKLKQIFQQLIIRHPSLRTKYQERKNVLVQEVRETAVFDFEKIDASNWNEKELNSYLLKSVKTPFDLEASSLFRVRLFSRSANDNIFLLTLHQLAGDRRSLAILLSEFLSLYNSQELPPLNSDYQNYVTQELNLLNSNEAAKIANFWKEELNGELPILSLPTNKAKPILRTYNGSFQELKIDRATTKQLKQIAKQEKVTLDKLLLAAFNVLLYRYTREEDILVAVVENRQNKSEYDRVVGNFSNAFVSRNIISGELSFKEILDRIDRKIEQIKDKQNYPFPLLVQQLKSADNLVNSPICQAAFSYTDLDYLEKISQILEKESTKCGELQVKYLPIDREKVEFDLTLEIIEKSDCLQGKFKYNCDLLDSETVKKIVQHFENLITAIVEDNLATKIAKLNLLSESEKKEIIVNWNDTKRDYDLSKCLHQLIEERVEKNPDRIAVEYGEEKLTYRELNNRANQLANYLQKQGVKPNNLVGISVKRSLEMVIGLLGILKSGGAYVPIDPGYPSDRLAYMLEDSQTNLLLTQEKVKNKLPQNRAKTICLDKDWGKIERENNNNLVTEITPDNLAYVIYTSGSTGKPKGAMNGHRGICNRLLWMQEEYQLKESDRILQKTPFSFDVSVWEFFWPLMTGARLIVAKPGGHTDSNYLAKIIAAKEITTVHFVPSMLQVFLEEKELEKCQKLKRIIASGEALPYELQQRCFDRLECELHNLYGPTEAAIDVTYWQCQPNSDLKKVPIGRPVANTQIYILDSYLQPVPIGVPGELHIGGVQVALGYLNRPQLTAEKFITNPLTANNQQRLYKTGDLARYFPDGKIEYIRRIDRQIKIRGLRIELGEIENSLAQYSDIRETAVIARKEPSGQQLVAYIVLRQEAENNISPADLRNFLKAKLPDYMIPAAFVVLESLPLTHNGKLNRRALPAPDISSFSGNNSLVPPRDEIEIKLAKIWSKLLNIDPVGVKDSFFDLGGHSLLAINLISQIRQEFGKDISLAKLFSDRTIEDLANLIRSQSNVNSYSPIVPIQPKGTKQPFFCVHPAGGHVLCYASLSRYLGSDRPFYGLQARGFNAGEEALTTVEEMASLYVKAIREFLPEGPYQIGGWSFGGVVAYEIAQQLQRQGQEVSLLALLDSYVPILLDRNKKIDDLYLVGVLSRVFGGMFGQDNLVSPQELLGLSVEEQINYIIAKAKQAGIFPPGVEEQQNRRILDVLVGTLKATYAYRRQAYPGKVTIFRAEQKHLMANDPQLVWVELSSILDVEDIEIISVPGNHYTFILEPHVKVLAERLAPHIS